MNKPTPQTTARDPIPVIPPDWFKRSPSDYPKHPSQSLLFWSAVAAVIISSGMIGWSLRGLIG